MPFMFYDRLEVYNDIHVPSFFFCPFRQSSVKLRLSSSFLQSLSARHHHPHVHHHVDMLHSNLPLLQKPQEEPQVMCLHR